MLTLISSACVFLIFLDYHKSRNIHTSIIFVAVFFGVIFTLSFALKIFKFKLLFLVILIPTTLFGVLFFKNRNNTSETLDGVDQKNETDELDSF